MMVSSSGGGVGVGVGADELMYIEYGSHKWKLSSSKKHNSSLSRRSRSSSSSSSSASNKCSFTRKCAALVKEQRARFYIMRRCVTMLLCWRDNHYSDS
ncbi:UNVERIFIED_CONTAM: hypothetical protein Sangu_0776000 [Sesamum angustifolium]|uniref:ROTUNDIFOLIA like 8 n=1 Tax=Sesamum angustifolium TaxID=2727405 RepID=A0AAW2PU43_9LAMI